VIRVNRQEGPSRGQRSTAPPPPGVAAPITSPVPATVPPPVIVKITVEIILDIVVYLSRPVVPEILDIVLIVAPFRAVKPVPQVSVLPCIANIVPVPGAVVPEVIQPPLIVFTEFVPILLAIRDCLISLG
jgi:hypothetical protein